MIGADTLAAPLVWLHKQAVPTQFEPARRHPPVLSWHCNIGPTEGFF